MLPTLQSGVRSSCSCTGLSGPCEGPCSEPWSGGLGRLQTHGWFVYLCISVFIVCSYVAFFVYLCVSGWLCIFIRACLHLCMNVRVSVCVLVGGVYACWLCVRECICVCLCLYTHMGASFGIAFRGRGLPVHAYLPVASLGHWYPVELTLVVAVVHPTKHHHTALRLASAERREGDPWRTVAFYHKIR